MQGSKCPFSEVFSFSTLKNYGNLFWNLALNPYFFAVISPFPKFLFCSHKKRMGTNSHYKNKLALNACQWVYTKEQGILKEFLNF